MKADRTFSSSLSSSRRTTPSRWLATSAHFLLLYRDSRWRPWTPSTLAPATTPATQFCHVKAVPSPTHKTHLPESRAAYDQSLNAIPPQSDTRRTGRGDSTKWRKNRAPLDRTYIHVKQLKVNAKKKVKRIEAMNSAFYVKYHPPIKWLGNGLRS